MIVVLFVSAFAVMALAASLATSPSLATPSNGNTFIVRFETVGTVDTALPTVAFVSQSTLSFQASFRNGGPGGDILTPSVGSLANAISGSNVVIGPNTAYTTVSFVDPNLSVLSSSLSPVYCLNNTQLNSGTPVCSSPLSPIGGANGLVFNTIFISQTTQSITGQTATCTTTNPSVQFFTTNISTIQTGFGLQVLQTPGQTYDCNTIPVFMRGFAPACTVLVEDVGATTNLLLSNEVVHFKTNVLSASTSLTQTAFQSSPSFAPTLLPRLADYAFDIASSPTLQGPNGGVDRTVEVFFSGATPSATVTTFDSCWVSVLNVAHRETNGGVDAGGANFLFSDSSNNVFHYGNVAINGGSSKFIELPASAGGVTYNFFAFSNNAAASAFGFSSSQFNASALSFFNGQGASSVVCKTNKFSLVTLSTSSGNGDLTQYVVKVFDVTPTGIASGWEHQVVNLINPGFSTTSVPSINVLQLATSTTGSSSFTTCTTHISSLGATNAAFDNVDLLSSSTVQLAVTDSSVTCACSFTPIGTFGATTQSGCGRHVSIITGRVETFTQEFCTTAPVSSPSCLGGATAGFQNRSLTVVQTNLDVLNANDNSFIGFSGIPTSSGVTVFTLDIPNCACNPPPPPPGPVCTNPCEAAILAAVDSIKPPSPTPTSCSSAAQVQSVLKVVNAVKKSTDTIHQLRQKIIAVHKSIFRQCSRHHH